MTDQENRAAPSQCGPHFGRLASWTLARVLWRTTRRGKKRVPRKGPVILIANHVGFIDGPVVHGVAPRPVHILVKTEMFRGFLDWFLTAVGQIEVDASGREALTRARQVLKRGGVVGVFPEGSRGAGAAENLQGGAAWLALHTGASVVPVALFGTRRTGEPVGVWPRPGRKIIVEFGAPFSVDPPTELKGRARQQHAEDTLAKVLRAHVESAASRSSISLPTDDPLREKEA